MKQQLKIVTGDPQDHETNYSNISSKREMLLPAAEFWTPARDIKDRKALLSDEPVLIKGLGTDGDWQKGCDVWQWIWRFRNGFGVSLTSNESNRSEHWGNMDAAVIYYENLDTSDRDLDFHDFHLINKMTDFENRYIDVDLKEDEVKYGFRKRKDSVHKNKKNLSREDITAVFFENILDDLPSWEVSRGWIAKRVDSPFSLDLQDALQEVKSL